MRVRDELQPDNHGLEEVGDTCQGVRVVAGPHPPARQHQVGSPRQTVQHQRRSVHYDSTARQLLNQEGDEYRQHPRDDREHRTSPWACRKAPPSATTSNSRMMKTGSRWKSAGRSWLCCSR